MENETRRVQVVVTVQQVQALKRLATRSNRTFSSVLREAIAEYTGVEDAVQLGGQRRKVAAAK